MRCEVYNFARKLCKSDQATADDVLQETLLKAWQAWEQWEPSHEDNVEGSARGWLFRIASNVFLSLCRHRKYQREVHYEKRDAMIEGLHGVLVNRSKRVEPKKASYDHDGCSTDFETSVGLRSVTEFDFNILLDAPTTASLDFDSPDVKAAIGRLHPQRQLLLNLRYVKRQRLSEIARSLQVPAPTVRVRLTRTHNRLRPLLARHAREEWGLRGAGVQAIGEATEEIKADSDGVNGIMAHDDSALLPVT